MVSNRDLKSTCSNWVVRCVADFPASPFPKGEFWEVDVPVVTVSSFSAVAELLTP